MTTEPPKTVTNVEHEADCQFADNPSKLYLGREVWQTAPVVIETDDDGSYIMPPWWGNDELLEPVVLKCAWCSSERYVVLDIDDVPVELTTANCPRSAYYPGHYGRSECEYCGYKRSKIGETK